MPFFNIATDSYLIREEFRAMATARPEFLADIESEVLDQFTFHLPYTSISEYSTYISHSRLRSLGYGLLGDNYVLLSGYHTDTSLANTKLARELKRAIAKVINWRFEQLGISPLVMNKSAGGGLQMAITLASNAHDAFPPNWDAGLIAFDLRPITSGW